MWEDNFVIDEVKEIRGRSTIYLGVGAINKINDIAVDLKNKGIDKVVVVTGRGAYKSTGAWDFVEKALTENNIGYVLYNKVMPNPTVDQVDEASKLANEFGAKAVIGIGGGSSIDAAKSVAMLIEYPHKTARELCEFTFIPSKAAPIIAINLTHGTGTETNRFAVVSIPEKEFKPAIAYDFIYPLYSIDDPALMVNLSKNQTIYVTVDAVNHVIEAATTLANNPYSILLAKETIRLAAKYLPKVLENPKDLRSRYYLLYGSMLGGISFDNGLLHFTHALEHPLSAVKPDLAHGLGLGVILPAVVEQIYPTVSMILADILSPIVPDLKGTSDEASIAAKGVEKWLNSVGMTEKLSDIGFKEEDVEKLTNLAFNTPSLGLLLSLAPVPADRKTVEAIYRNSL